LTRLAGSSAVWRGWLVLTLGLPFAVHGQPAKPSTPTVDDLWNSLLQGAAAPTPEPVLAPQQVGGRASAANFLDHFFFEGRSDYWRYDTSFNSRVSTLTGIINAPNTGVFNPNGYPYPSIFQPGANRFETLLDLGTRGWGSDRINTHFTLRQYQDLTTVNPGSAAENIVETFPFNRQYQVLQASLEIHGQPQDGYWSGFSAQIGRLNIYGAELASLDGGSLSLDRPRFNVTIYGGRRFTFFSDPEQRGIGGVNFDFKLNPDTSLEYDGLWYIKATHSLAFRRRFGPAWLLSSYFRMVGSAPVDFSTQVMYTPGSGRTSLRGSFFQKLSNNDYFYDYTVNARDQDPYNTLLRLYLGPIAQYSQFTIDARRTLSSRVRLGGSVWLRRLNDGKDEGPFDTSFEDYRVSSQVFPLRKTEVFFEYHQRNSERLSPLTTTTLDNISQSGETSVKDLTGEIRHSFGEGRFGLNGGVYYRRVSLQDQFYFLNGLHQSGWLAGGWWKVDSHARIFFDYNLDNDFFLFTPDLKNSRALHAGVSWKY
jgi:hypothetical protein